MKKNKYITVDNHEYITLSKITQNLREIEQELKDQNARLDVIEAKLKALTEKFKRA